MADKISIIGLFCEGREVADGQSIKTRIVTQELESSVGKEHVRRIDTYGWKKHPVKLFLRCVHAVWSSGSVVFMTDAGGIRVFPWLLTLANFAKKCTIHYVVIGGWLNKSLENNKLRRYWLRKLDGIYVETSTMKSGLESRGLKKVVLLPNCKYLSILTEDELSHFEEEPYPLCTFSRVMKEKGIQDAVEAVREINQRFGRTIYTLDIYGQVDENQREWFEQLKSTFPEEIHYHGIVPYHQSTDVLKKYFALLFPTKLFYIEGVPGTIIDTYAAGVPVIASKWESYDDMIDEDTGIGYSSGSYEELVDSLEKVAMDPDLINKKRRACLQRAQMYSPECVMKILIEHLKN